MCIDSYSSMNDKFQGIYTMTLVTVIQLFLINIHPFSIRFCSIVCHLLSCFPNNYSFICRKGLCGNYRFFEVLGKHHKGSFKKYVDGLYDMSFSKMDPRDVIAMNYIDRNPWY